MAARRPVAPASPVRAERHARDAARTRAGGPGHVRIIGGQWKRTRLAVAPKPGLRPTPDRVRETLFNWLGQDLSGLYCLDAFAGSGALGFEAASRHAAHVTLVERDRQLCAQLQANARQLQARTITVRQGDGLHALQTRPVAATADGAAGWDVIFLDPPYAAELERPALQLARQSLAPHGLLYLESSQRWDDAALQPLGWQRLHYLKAGAVHAHVLRLAAA